MDNLTKDMIKAFLIISLAIFAWLALWNMEPTGSCEIKGDLDLRGCVTANAHSLECVVHGTDSITGDSCITSIYISFEQYQEYFSEDSEKATLTAIADNYELVKETVS